MSGCSVCGAGSLFTERETCYQCVPARDHHVSITDDGDATCLCGWSYSLEESIGVRLSRERVRLRLTQSECARLAGVAKNTLINWENDKGSPTAVALQALARSGLNVIYVLSGKSALSRLSAQISARKHWFDVICEEAWP